MLFFGNRIHCGILGKTKVSTAIDVYQQQPILEDVFSNVIDAIFALKIKDGLVIANFILST